MDLIRDTALRQQKALQEASNKRMAELYRRLKQKLEEINQALTEVSELEEELDSYVKNLNLILEGGGHVNSLNNSDTFSFQCSQSDVTLCL